MRFCSLTELRRWWRWRKGARKCARTATVAFCRKCKGTIELSDYFEMGNPYYRPLRPLIRQPSYNYLEIGAEHVICPTPQDQASVNRQLRQLSAFPRLFTFKVRLRNMLKLVLTNSLAAKH